MTINKLITSTSVIFLLTFYTFCCYAKTYQYDVKFPDYLSEKSSVNSVVCSIESMKLNKHVDQKQIILEMMLNDFTIDSNLNGFKFRLSKDHSLEFFLPEPNIDITTASYKKEIIQNEEIENIVDRSIMSFKKRIPMEAQLVGYEIERIWMFLGNSFDNMESTPLFNEHYQSQYKKIAFQNSESSKLPVEYSEWSLNQDNKQYGTLELNIEYQLIDSIYIPHHIVIYYPSLYRGLKQHRPWFDITFYNCKIE